ncbi:STAS domain protein [Phycisphaerae bacterium RAS1]|nr:STAS domain protein [Phycisphaerae bacterium RAS1]
MKVDVERQGSVSVIVPRDAITEASTETVEQAVSGETSSGGVRLVIDMTHVPFVDSAGIECLVRMARTGSSTALRLRVASLSETVREALYLTGTLKQLSVYDSVESAVRSYL